MADKSENELSRRLFLLNIILGLQPRDQKLLRHVATPCWMINTITINNRNMALQASKGQLSQYLSSLEASAKAGYKEKVRLSIRAKIFRV